MATGVMCALYERFIAIVTFSALPFAGLPAAIPARREYPPTKPADRTGDQIPDRPQAQFSHRPPDDIAPGLQFLPAPWTTSATRHIT